MRKKVFLITGGSGGHIFPAISLTEIDKKFDYYFLLDYRTEKIVKKRGLKYFKIFSSNIHLNFSLPLSVVKVILGFLQSIFIFIKYKPNLAIGFGGYTSIPSILAAKLLKVKIIIHEQNAVMGKTNRLLSYLSKNIALTFTNTKHARDYSVHTGIPVRKKKLKPKRITKTKTIFIVGGSQGASIFSNLIPKILENFSDFSKRKLIVVQQVRKVDEKFTAKLYRKMKVKFILKEFFDDIYSQFNQADLIISRCGASTLAEIELYKKFSVLFPLPSAMNNHQYFNAIEFRKKNPCLLLDERDLNIIKISKEIEKIIFINKKLHKIKTNKQLNHKLSLSNLIRKVLINNV